MEKKERARKGGLELLAAEEKAHQMQQETHQVQQETARLQLQVKKTREEQQKPYGLGSPVYNNVGMLYNSEQLSGCNQMYPNTATFYVNAVTEFSRMSSVEGDSINCANAMYGSGSGNFIESVKVNGKSCLGQIMASNITLVKADLVKEEDYLANQSVNVVVPYEFTERNDLKPVSVMGIDLPGEGFSKCLSEKKSCLSVSEVSECLSNVSEMNLELDQAQKDLIGQDNVSQEQIKVDGQVKALIEEGKGRFLMGDGLLASTACKSDPAKGNCDLLEVAQISEKSSSLSVGSGNVPGKESLDEPRQPYELMALSSQQFGKARIVEDECPYTLPVTCVENCDSEGNVPVSARSIDLPMEGATPVSKQLSVNSPVCWDKGNEIPSCVPGKGECVSGSSLSVEQTEGAFRPVMVENSVVVSELVLNSTKAQEGNGPKFVSDRENGTVTRFHPVNVYAKSQRPHNSGACILLVASVLLEKGVATLSDQGDILARAQGEHKGDLIVLPTDSLTTCSKKEKIPKLVCGKGKENASNLLSTDLVKEEDYLANQSVNVVVPYEFTMHISILAPDHLANQYINHMGYFSMVLQALVDHKGHFTDISVGWLRKVHDARIFRNSELFKQLQEGTYFSDQKITIGDVEMPIVILGDPTYPMLPWLMKPYTSSLNSSKEQFNDRLNKCRMVIECAFGHLKAHWCCLLTRLDLSATNISIVIAVCCLLHNICESKGETFMAGWDVEANCPASSFEQPDTRVIRRAQLGALRSREALKISFMTGQAMV
ncbi:hypothetical protein UY3_11460 [Chelonia mydas]|uniref:DDE Tnp4 domain-containing protein n=1 Tax=Chelonia mydas TaxID=8469 RepID=M7B2X1_CHEMY|nr:hypothetical protein UY3_11460 [Chelonia mydas]